MKPVEPRIAHSCEVAECERCGHVQVGGLTIKGLIQRAFKTATDKGWHNPEKSSLEYHALFHSEISEATEAARNGGPAYEEVLLPFIIPDPPELMNGQLVPTKPEGELVELADTIIRIADYCGARGWDLEAALLAKMSYNETRSYRHCGKKF